METCEIVDIDQQMQALSALARRAMAISVATLSEAESAGQVRGEMKTDRAKWVAWNAGPKQKAHELHKSLTARENQGLKIIDQAIGIIDDKLRTFETERRRKAMETQRLLDEQARKVAEERQLAEAEALDKAGPRAEAERHLEAPIVVATPIVQVQKFDTVSFVERWTHEVVDEAAVPRQFCSPDDKKIRAHVLSHKGATRIAGVQVKPVLDPRSK